MTRRQQKRALALLGGSLNNFPISHNDWYIIAAADGGAVHALDQGVWPDIVIGDYDSLTPAQTIALDAGAAPRINLPDGDELTDGEAVVRWLLEQHVQHIVLAGALGGTFDHTLGNIMLLHTLADHRVDGYATDGVQRVYLLRDEIQLTAQAGDRLSIVPFTRVLTGVNVSGVKWPLVEEVLHRSRTRGISNVAQGPVVTCTARDGMAFVIHTPR